MFVTRAYGKRIVKSHRKSRLFDTKFTIFSNFHTAPVLPRSDITLQAVLAKICSTSHFSQLGPRRVKIWSSKTTLNRQETQSWVKIFNFSDFSKFGIFGGHGEDLFVNTAPATEKLRSLALHEPIYEPQRLFVTRACRKRIVKSH